MNFAILIGKIFGVGAVMAAEELRDVKPPVAEELALLSGFLEALVIALLLALVVFIIRRFRRRHKIRKIVDVLPWDKALKELESLQRENLPQRKEAALFYSRLSGIIRRYIEERFAIRAPEMTTDEFLQAIRHKDIFDAEQKSLLQQFLIGSDMVKFARYAASEAEMRQHYDLAVNFVRRTAESTVNSRQSTEKEYSG